ncbi:TPA: hypothetical protein ACMDRZ_003157 [Vibrio cholerae]|uniref:hypothetical protein n=1 Tax=Vibrio cholerae TaxID=666 RepID=UPI0015830FC3|nr:hypothetical protein [Vibrio cholerae]EJL6307351.1 hypothetical protein [Vibrio cholerae]EJL6310944.1 hypothetical protein [Vibrio cholerae]EJL6419582.1 hypothetical protein [Vibrio cholerae]EJL6582336.1 hypothetical protein [Vibrio cholerae]EKA4522946.1 hypothetical protein [Vibrio cholerae]
MFWNKQENIDWKSKPLHNSLDEALHSSDSAPYKIKAVIERCGIASGANYGGLILAIEGDSHFISCYPNGGVQDWVALSRAGDSVLLLVDHEYELGKPVADKFNAIDFINITLEEQFGQLSYKRGLSNNKRDWTE